MKNHFNVCIIDDDDIYQFTIVKTIKALGLAKKIMVFSDGEEAKDFMLDNIKNNYELPDVIFLDNNMPIMDGFQFMEEYVKFKPQLDKKITVYMVSSSVDPVDIERANNVSEINGYIIKPIKPGQLKSIIENLNA
ncbi:MULTISPECIES: response regulator [Cellulophaga]|uniref:Response regulator receiver n=2 Tax=Cellulophaga TaxID=104264 RepID=F0REJ7_CELLC|nr:MULTISPECIES: response regulator [Cellulophaga]ADY31012.1 response regulator receiver [Cellulophaga lytica DSM 7489]APU11885.1 transcriptional regulator [Cellulophaga lytica]EWH13377.1 response regulator receiver [Cellulophaga geojensis KL-A]MDO6852889.1 response regulator [Cellulophaga lytica]TVZ09666.1 response regulator receiver domain-containing protein [Cellulophaga sp. RHA_52]